MVTALDRTTGREQSITGASTLNEAEVKRMIQEALNMQTRPRTQTTVQRAESLTVEAERELKQVALDFARNRRQRIETIAVELEFGAR